MRKTGKIAVALLAGSMALGLTACGTGAPKAETTGEHQEVDNGYGAGDLVPVIVELGDDRTVECVALIGYNKGGVTCNWEAVEQR